MKRHFFSLMWLFSSLTTNLFAQGSYKDSTFTEYFRRNSNGWTAGDATISVPLPDGRSVWLFGDSYVVPVNLTNNSLPCLFSVRNCMMVQEASNNFVTLFDSTRSGVARTFFKLGPADADTAWFWPGHGFTQSDTLYIFLYRWERSINNFAGIYIAKLTISDLELRSITRLPAMNEITFGKAVLYDSTSGYLYVYGNKRNFVVFEPYVARCFPNNITGAWEYYTGSSWSMNPALAQKISSFAVSPSFSAIKIKNTFYLITQENGYLICGLGRKIFAYASNSPAGPFGDQKLLYTIEDTAKGSYMITYNAQAHPQFTSNNELLISYNVNGICPSECQRLSDRRNADGYRPKFIRVPHDMLSGGVAVSEVTVNPPRGFLLEPAYPNPFNLATTIHFIVEKTGPAKLVVFDVNGREVAVLYDGKALQGEMQSVQFDATKLASGTYFYRLTTPSLSATRSLTFIK